MRIFLAISMWLACFASPAFAYIGPGAGLSAIGSVLAFLGVIGLLFLGFLWYPVKRLFNTVRGNHQGAEGNDKDEAV